MQSVSASAHRERRWRKKALARCARAAALVSSVLFLTACNVQLYDNLDQRQANDIISVLFRQGIPAERVVGKDGKYAVKVDEGRFSEAIAILNDHGLPKQNFASLGEVFKNDGIVASPVQERAQMIYALSQELSRTISDIDGVLTARVHLVLPENDPLRQQLIPSSASVFIRHLASAPLNSQIPQVKMLVANGIAGLSYDKVSVVLVPVDPPPAPAAGKSDQEMSTFLGMWIHRDSVARAAWIFYSLLVLLVAACGGLAFLLAAQRKRVYILPTSTRAKTS